MQPGTAATTLASAVAASGMIGPILRFALRRPFAAAIGGVLIFQAGKAIWRGMQTPPAPVPANEAAVG